MTGVVAASVRVGRLVIALALGLLVVGGTQLAGAKVDYLPEFMPPAVQVQTEALGLSAAEVEQLVTVPLEQDLLNGVPWLDHIHSRSQPGLSAIDVVFETGTDLYAARQMVQERLTQAHALPNVGSAPVMVEPLASVSRVSMIGMTSTEVPLIDMSVLARWKVRPKLMGIPGVANVSIYGLRDRQLQVQVDPARLSAQGVSLTQVIETTGNALWVSPLTFVEASTPGTGGFIEGANQRLAVQHVLPITTAVGLGQVAVEGGQTPLRLADVATVVEDHQPLIGDAVNATPSLFLVVQKFPDADTLAVTQAVDAAMSSLRPGLSGIDVDTSAYRPATFLESAARTTSIVAGLTAALLLAAASLVFWSWRAGLVIGASVTTTTVTTLFLLTLRGVTLTALTLAGLLVAVVLVVAESAATVGEVRRSITSGDDGEHPNRGAQVVDAVGRSRMPALVGFLVATLAVIPALFLDPLTTSFTRAAVTTFVLTLVIGAVVSLTLTPALLDLIMRPTRPAVGRPRVPGRRRLDRLAVAARRGASGRVVGTVTVLLLAAVTLAAVAQLQTLNLVPTAREDTVLLRLETAPGTSLAEMNRVSGLVSRELRSLPGVRTLGGHVGRAVGSDQLGDVNEGELWVGIDPEADYPSTRSAIASVAARWPGVRITPETYAEDRVSSVAASGASDLVIRLYGQDLAALQRTAVAVTAAVAGATGLTDAHVVPIAQQPTVHVEVDLAAAQKYGLRPGDVRREATTLVSGLTVGNLYEQARIFDVVVLGTPDARLNLTGFANLAVDTPSGSPVRLGDVAKVSVAAEPASIVHDQVQRSVDVVADIDGDPASVVTEVRRAVGEVAMPAESHLEVLSAALDRQVDGRRMLLVSLAVLIGIVLVLQAATGSWRASVVLCLLAPLGAAGAALVAPLVGGLGTIGPLLGAICAGLLALTVGLRTVRSTRPLDDPVPDSLPHPTTVPTVPTWPRAVLLTGVALLPGALAGSRAGTEILQPFAVTTLGGLVTVAVVLWILPALAGHPKGVLR